jgi:uncharacterized protein YecE (DUF72 family)
MIVSGDSMLWIGTAGWSVPKKFTQVKKPQLTIYSQLFHCCEINSTFYKDPMFSTLEKWKDITAENFSFSLKLHQNFTHLSGLNPNLSELRKTLRLYHALGDKWGALLLQFPPKSEFNKKKMDRFYKILRGEMGKSIPIVIEPRNISWLDDDSLQLLKTYKISKVIADPERCPGENLNFSGIRYYRLHGSPEIYRSSYSKKFLNDLAFEIKKKKCWCIFDNTASGNGFLNAYYLNKKSHP